MSFKKYLEDVGELCELTNVNLNSAEDFILPPKRSEMQFYFSSGFSPEAVCEGLVIQSLLEKGVRIPNK